MVYLVQPDSDVVESINPVAGQVGCSEWNILLVNEHQHNWFWQLRTNGDRYSNRQLVDKRVERGRQRDEEEKRVTRTAVVK